MSARPRLRMAERCMSASPDEIRRVYREATIGILVAILMAAFCVAAMSAAVLWLGGVR